MEVMVAGQVRVLKNGGVSTSGDEFQGFDVGGVRYSHIVDPRTGQALETLKPLRSWRRLQWKPTRSQPQ